VDVDVLCVNVAAPTMPRNWTDSYTFLLGAVANAQLAFFVTHDDETAAERTPYSSFLTLRDGEWIDGGTRPWPTVSVASIPGDMVQLIALGEAGQIFLKGGGEEREELIVKGDEGPATRGPMRCIRAVGGQVYAVGSDRQVYRRKGPSRWEAFDAGARPESAIVDKPVEKAPPKKKPAVRPKTAPLPIPSRTAEQSSIGFEALDGYSTTELYAAGRRGEIWQWDGTRWHKRDSSLSEKDTITHLTCAPDGVVYLAGDKGQLLRGRNEAWEKLPSGVTEPILGLRLFDGALYASTKKGLFRHDGKSLVAVALPKKDAPKTFGPLDVVKDALWSIGGKDIFTYDGNTWTRIE
jgi:hypothetical protein